MVNSCARNGSSSRPRTTTLRRATEGSTSPAAACHASSARKVTAASVCARTPKKRSPRIPLSATISTCSGVDVCTSTAGPSFGLPKYAWAGETNSETISKEYSTPSRVESPALARRDVVQPAEHRTAREHRRIEFDLAVPRHPQCQPQQHLDVARRDVGEAADEVVE